MSSNRPVEAYLNSLEGSPRGYPICRASLPAVAETAVHLAATETARAIASGRPEESLSRLTTLDTLTLQTQTHVVVPRPQCPRCGHLSSRPDRDRTPLSLQHQHSRFSDDGGLRIVSPDRTFERYAHHISPITGAVSHVIRAPEAMTPFVHVYYSGHNPASVQHAFWAARTHMRSDSSGKGATDVQARTSA